MQVFTDLAEIQSAQPGIKNLNILCCLCGTSFNVSETGTNICLRCISSEQDITTRITREATIDHCEECNRYLRPPWIRAEPESKELLDICLKRVRGLNKVKLVDANFIWTEPHSKKIKVKLTVQKEVTNNTSVQQSFPVEFTLNPAQCNDCRKSFTPHIWKAVIQVRQRVDHKKTFYFLEQLLLKNNLHEKMQSLEEAVGGMDFFFKEKADASRMIEFMHTMFPVKMKTSKQMISYNERDKTIHNKHTFLIEMPRVCKDDLVVLKPKLASSLGGCGKLLLCTKVGSVIQFIDIMNMKIVELSGATYFQHEDDMVIIPAHGNLTEFMVFDVELSGSKNLSFVNTRFKAATVSVGRVTDWENFEVKTHIGDVLEEGSSVKAFDLTTLNLTGYYDDIAQLGNLPDVVIVKKVQSDKESKKRIWKLKHLEKQEKEGNNSHKANAQKEKDDQDYEDFLSDVELDDEMRSHMNLYKDEKAIKALEKEPSNNKQGDVEIDAKKEEAVPKKKGDVKSKSKGKRAAKKSEEEEEKSTEEKEKKKGGEKEYFGVKIDELLQDAQGEQMVKVGQKLSADEKREENDESDEEGAESHTK